MSAPGGGDGSGRRVWVLYHWLGHYRQAVCESLIRSSPNRYEFWGSPTSYGQGIKVVTDLPEGRFRATRLLPARGFYIQPSAVWHALFGRYDDVVIHAGGRWPTMWAAAVIARLRRKRVYYWMQGWTREDSAGTRRFKKLYYGLAHGLLLYGHFGKCLGIASGFDPSRMHVIYNSLDVERQLKAAEGISDGRLDGLRRELFPDRPGAPIVSTVSRLTTPKRLDLLIEACAALERGGCPVNLLIAGDGPERATLVEQAERSGVKANFIGAVYEEERIAELMLASAVGVVPGPIGLFVMHAMVFGTPVISNDCYQGQGPEFEAIVPGVTGDFFRDGDAASLSETIRRWVTPEVAPAMEPVMKPAMEPVVAHDDRRALARERIRTFYHPSTQRALIDRAIGGAPADDLVMAQWNRARTLGG